jgi:trehalose/maltose hydrolase-like predicted phosphorylase
VRGNLATEASPTRGVPSTATGDEQFLERCGAEMLVETARLWLDLAFYSAQKDGRFCINAVTGPDEYNKVVNNNAYTNLMAQENLRYAAHPLRYCAQQSRMHTRNSWSRRRLISPKRKPG